MAREGNNASGTGNTKPKSMTNSFQGGHEKFMRNWGAGGAEAAGDRTDGVVEGAATVEGEEAFR